MQKKLCLALSLSAICYWADASPAKLGTLEFDKLDTDLDNLKYEVEEEDLDDYSKLLDDADQATGGNSEQDTRKKQIKTSGFKRKNTENKGLKRKHNIGDLKRFFKTVGVKDDGEYNDDDIYAEAEGVIAEAVGAEGNEERKYRKGTKTRGFHRVHHKDEYKKDKEFYEDDETKGAVKKVGGKALGYKIGGGAGFNKGHIHHDHKKGVYGKQGYLDKGFQDDNFSEYSDGQGFKGTFNYDS